MKNKSSARKAANDAKPRKRATISMERRLAITLAAIVALCKKRGLTDPIIATGEQLSAETTNKTLKPIQDRLKVVQSEISALDFAKDPSAGQKAKELSTEIVRLQNRERAIMALVSGS